MATFPKTPAFAYWLIFFSALAVSMNHDLSQVGDAKAQFWSSLFGVPQDQVQRFAAGFAFSNASLPKDAVSVLIFNGTPEAREAWSRAGPADVDCSRPTVVFVPGFWEPPTNRSVRDLATAYRDRDDVTLLEVDWTIMSFDMVYPTSAAGTKSVALFLGDFLLEAIGEELECLSKVHLVGHSLGAHIAGMAGKYIREQTGRLVETISGLDPAGPLFVKPVLIPAFGRVNKGDAKKVQLIHTDKDYLGMEEAFGDVDFFVHGGGTQPGCTPLPFSVIFETNNLASCSHKLSVAYFTDSVNDARKFVGVACDSFDQYKAGKCDDAARAVMGNAFSRNASGTFYLEPNQTLPWTYSALDS